MTLTVKAGRANINGAFYWQKDDETITLEKNNATKSYNIILRLNDNDAYRNITLVASDINNGITRSDSIYDLVLATVTVTGNASEVKGSDITDTRLDSTRCGAVTSAIKSVQSLDLFTQVTELFKEIKAQNESEMNANRTEFNDWFETVKDTLDADTAGKLSNRISSVEKMIMDNHFTTVLLAEDGTLVDENGHEILADWKYKVDGNQDLNGDSGNIGDSDNIAYELENLRNQMKFELEQIKAETSQLNDALMEKIMYLESNVTVTDGERGHRTNAKLDMSQPIYVSITPTTTNTFNVFITHEETEVQFLTALNINGGETHTFVFNREIIDNVAKDYGINAFDDKWRVNIRNATNSKNYRYSIFTKENEKVLHDKKVYVSSTKDAGTFSLVSYACNYLKAKYDNVPCTVFVKNGVYEEKPITEFPYAPINIADTMINIIGESVDGVIINLTNSSQKQNRIMHIGGFQTIANMTLNVLADDTYQGNNGNNPYAIHNDDTYNDFTGHYSTTVENCKLYSECSSPIGGGLHGNQTQIYRNVVFIYNSKHDGGGCLYVHGASNEGQIPDGLIIDGCTAISKNGTLALTLPSVVGYTPYTETPVTIRRTILATNGDTEVASDFKSTHKLTSDSKLNSNDYINY